MGGLLDGLGDLGKGIKDGVDGGLGAIEDGVDSGKRALGETVDWVTDQTGERLDAYGLHKAADVVTDWGDGFASDLGATPGEKQLGQTEDANELVRGDPAKILASAAHLKDFRAAFEKVGQGMRKVDSSRWKGLGGDAFREKFGVHPTKWLHAADACETAAAALEAYADAVRWAQGRASEAVEMYREGRRVSDEAKAAAAAKGATDATVTAAHEAGKAAETVIAEARARLSDAREQRNTAATEAEARVERALAHAPAEPPPLDRLGGDLADGFQAYNLELNHVVGGALKGTAGLLNFVRGLNPMDAYNVTHPAAYLQNVSMTLSGLVSTAAHPDRAVTAAVESFNKDRGEFFGRLIPELFGTKGTGLARGGLRLAAKEGLETGATNLATKGAKYGDDLATTPPHPPHPPSPPSWADNAAAHPPPTAGPAEQAVSGLPKSWTIDTPGPTGLLDDVPAANKWDDLAAGHGNGGFTYEPHVSADEFRTLSPAEQHNVAVAELGDGAVKFPDNDAAIAYGRENWNDYAESLPEPTRKSVLDYTREPGGISPDPHYATYREINGYLRGDTELGTPDVLRNIEEMDRALAGRPLSEDVMVARGQGVSHLGVERHHKLVGEVMTEPAYMSTSLGNAAFGSKPGILYLRVPKGTPALWVEKVGYFGMGERELVLGRGIQYKVTRGFEDASGQWHIYGEVLPGN
ncbi:hypothetical protein KV205_11375 [Streptomyces sp. SKN60]|uniref:putative T7SS-secreted protein n=1 Tax=Streptomyces sp. SKN60 TaxID=2855506 RepID=UPI002247D5DB|nr:ADP-ribosyltransferase [Streptomyces sp. SKN60]MCX2181128.1 hypothetical protein [Streptomyces sp. SKN60]